MGTAHDARRTRALFVGTIAEAAAAERRWVPALDAYRTPTGWLLKLELAGVRPGDVEVLVAGSSLFVTGVRRDTCPGDALTCLRLEIAYTPFERRIDLPADLSGAQIATDLRDGILTVRVDRNE